MYDVATLWFRNPPSSPMAPVSYTPCPGDRIPALNFPWLLPVYELELQALGAVDERVSVTH